MRYGVLTEKMPINRTNDEITAYCEEHGILVKPNVANNVNKDTNEKLSAEFPCPVLGSVERIKDQVAFVEWLYDIDEKKARVLMADLVSTKISGDLGNRARSELRATWKEPTKGVGKRTREYIKNVAETLTPEKAQMLKESYEAAGMPIPPFVEDALRG